MTHHRRPTSQTVALVGLMLLLKWIHPIYNQVMKCHGEDIYSPCHCEEDEDMIKSLGCDRVPMEIVRKVFQQQITGNLGLHLTLLESEDKVVLDDLLAQHRRIDYIRIVCSSSDQLLKVELFNEEINSQIKEFGIFGCNLTQLNFAFLKNIKDLETLTIFISTDVNISSWPEILKGQTKLSTINIENCEKLEFVTRPNIATGPSSNELGDPISNPRLRKLYIQYNRDLGDETMSRILKWISSISNKSLEQLHIPRNGLTRIPEEMSSLSALNWIDLSRNSIGVVRTGSLAFASPVHGIILRDCSVAVVESGAMAGDFSNAEIDLSYNLLTRFEASIFREILREMMNRSTSDLVNTGERITQVGGLHKWYHTSAVGLKIHKNSIDCTTDVCHLAWIFRDNLSLALGVQDENNNPSCSNGTSFKNLDPNGFNHCPNLYDKSITVEQDSKLNVGHYLSIAVLVCIVCLLLSLLGRAIFINKKRQQELRMARLALLQGTPERINPDLPLEEQVSLLPYDPQWEIPIHNILIGKQLGAGNFGIVFEGTISGKVNTATIGGGVTRVAIKMVKSKTDDDALKSLISELKILIHLGSHLNVVNLIGAYTLDIVAGNLFVVLEFCAHGNVRSYLLANRTRYVNQLVDDFVGQSSTQQFEEDAETDDSLPKENNGYLVPSRIDSSNGYEEMRLLTNVLNTQTLIYWSYQVSCGMNYMASKKVLHGDLAARNVLLTDDNVVQIADFGLSRQIKYQDANYRKTGEEALPIKWMAIESLADRIFSTQSDVWSFGIFLWELFSLGALPYAGVATFTDLARLLKAGQRLQKPEMTPNFIWDLMVDCWKSEPIERPTFATLEQQLEICFKGPPSLGPTSCQNGGNYLKMDDAKFEN